MNSESKLNAVEQLFSENANLQSLANLQLPVWQADVDGRLLDLEQHKKDHANKVAEFEDMASAKLQSLAWQTGFDSRLLSLEQHTQDYASNVAAFEDRLSVAEKFMATFREPGEFGSHKYANKIESFQDRLCVIEGSTANLLELCEFKDQRHLDLKAEVAKLETIVSDLEEHLGRNSWPCVQETIDPQNVEQKRHSNNLTASPEDRNTFVNESVCGTSLAHDQEHLLQGRPDQKTNTNPVASLTHRLCVAEWHIDMIASILSHIETSLANSNGNVLASSVARSTRDRITRKRPSGKSKRRDMANFSQDTCESSGSVSQPDAAVLGMSHLENAPLKTRPRQIQEMLGRARTYLDQEVPLDERNLSWTWPTIIEESDSEAEMPTD